MNKQDWTYKTFGEVFDLQMGRTPDRKNPSLFGGDNIWVSIRDIDGKYIEDSKEHITNEAVIKSGIKLVKKGTVIMSFKLTVGKCAIARKDLYTNEAIMAFNVNKGFILDSSFLYYYLQGYRWSGTNKAVMGLTLNKATISKQKIAIPPIAEQERIVAELDLLQGIIEKKKEQLKAYDQLAQSIFYTMFGDPIDNPKGWETKRLGDVCSLKAGKAIKAAELKEKTADLYPCYGGNGIRGYIDKISHKEDLPIIGRQGALCGNVNFAKGPFYATEHAVVVTPLIEMNKIWLFHELKCSNLEQYAHGVAQPGIAVNDLNPITFPVPPLSLQEEFAEKVEAIERQKALVQQSIVETQTMFDCTMDKYFG